ncbi:MAG TPA: DinB family protein [Thermoanaerobaculaceae bacterium]|nr:DinB family protein [Thermoanaerobaculaceae bacterium]
MMRIADTLLPEWDHEVAVTRRVVERVPEDKLDWRPHAKSWTLRQLATHLVAVPSWMPLVIEKECIDMAPEGGAKTTNTPAGSRDELVQRLDGHAAAARQALAGADNATLLAPWSLKQAGTPVFTMPRAGVLRGFIFSHMIHHRAQLGVYLRLLDVPVPSMYGPSADESGG